MVFRALFIKYSNGGCSGLKPDSLLIYSLLQLSNRIFHINIQLFRIITHIPDSGNTRKMHPYSAFEALFLAVVFFAVAFLLLAVFFTVFNALTFFESIKRQISSHTWSGVFASVSMTVSPG